MIVCGIYYVVWIYVLPKWKGYAIRAKVMDVDGGGANTHRLVKVPLADLERWDSEHDDSGKLRSASSGLESDGIDEADGGKV